jgi:intracellular septation protein A
VTLITTPTTEPVRPPLREVIKHISQAILVANVIPSVLFYACLNAGNIWLALSSALLWCYGALAWRMSTGRAVSGLLVLTLIGLTGKTVFAFASGSTAFYFWQPALTEVAVALLFAASLLTARPLVARVAGDFYPMDDELHARPRIQQLFWRLTLLWALIVGVKAVVCVWLLTTVSTSTYASLKSVIAPSTAVIGAAVTVLISVHAARREGLLPGRAMPALA